MLSEHIDSLTLLSVQLGCIAGSDKNLSTSLSRVKYAVDSVETIFDQFSVKIGEQVGYAKLAVDSIDANVEGSIEIDLNTRKLRELSKILDEIKILLEVVSHANHSSKEENANDNVNKIESSGSLCDWMINSVCLLPDVARKYESSLLSLGIHSIARLKRKLLREPQFLSDIGVGEEDAIDLFIALDLSDPSKTVVPFNDSEKELHDWLVHKAQFRDRDAIKYTCLFSSKRAYTVDRLKFQVKTDKAFLTECGVLHEIDREFITRAIDNDVVDVLAELDDVHIEEQVEEQVEDSIQDSIQDSIVIIQQPPIVENIPEEHPKQLIIEPLTVELPVPSVSPMTETNTTPVIVLAENVQPMSADRRRWQMVESKDDASSPAKVQSNPSKVPKRSSFGSMLGNMFGRDDDDAVPTIDKSSAKKLVLVLLFENRSSDAHKWNIGIEGWTPRTNISDWRGADAWGNRRVVSNKAFLPIGLHFSEFRLSGRLCASISQITTLTELDLSTNQLTDKLPADIGCLVQLRLLDVSANQFCGDLPESIGYLSQLYQLNITSNLFDSIPSSIQFLPKLAYFYLSQNPCTRNDELRDVARLIIPSRCTTRL